MRRARRRLTQALALAVTAALIIPFSMSPAAMACTPPNEPFNMDLVATFGGASTPLGVDVTGGLAYVADAHGLRIYDVADVGSVLLEGDVAFAGGALDVRVAGGVAYLVGGDGFVHIVDVSDPSAADELVVLNCGSPAVRVLVDGSRLFVAAEDGIHIYSVVDPSAPSGHRFVSTPEPVSDLLLNGNILYAAYSYYTVADVSAQCVTSHLLALDVSATPVERSRHAIPYGHTSLALSGSLLYVAITHPSSGESYVKVFDVSNPAALSYITCASIPSFGAVDVVSDGALVYLAGLKGTSVYDFGSPASPYLAGLHQQGTERVDLADGYLFGTNPDTGVHVFAYTPSSERNGGANRYDTAVEVSRNFASASWVVIATGGNYPDGLAGGPLAYALGGPILLSNPKSGLSGATVAEIKRLGAKHAVILGGTSAVPSAVQSQLQSAGVPTGSIERIAGSDRYETARKIALRLKAALGGGAVGKAFIATGEAFPDALAASGVAAKMGAPVLLVKKSGIPAATSSALAELGVAKTIVLGGSTRIPDAVMKRLPMPKRLAGTDRFGTAKVVADWAIDSAGAGFSADQVIVATGMAFPDALSSGALGAKKGATTLLVSGDVPGATRAFLDARRAGISTLCIIGSPGAVSTEVERVMVSLID